MSTVDFYAAVQAQPAVLERSARAVRAGLAGIDLAPWRGGVFATVSMGAGTHAAHALVGRLARHGRRAVNLAGSDLVGMGSAAAADSYLFISEGGRSRETIEAAGMVPPGVRLGLTNAPDGPLSTTVDALLSLDAGADSKVYTVGYTTTIQACGLLAGELDGVDDGDDWARLPGLAEATLHRLAPAATRAAQVLARAASIDVVGGWGSFAAAAEAALLLRESTRIATATYETYQYLHGPMEPLTGAHAVLVFGSGREVALARYLARASVPTVLVTTAPVTTEEAFTVLVVPDAAAMSRSVLEILPAQLIAGEMARLRGLGIDGFVFHQDDTKVPA